jgi:nickel-dependent lactate racemase
MIGRREPEHEWSLQRGEPMNFLLPYHTRRVALDIDDRNLVGTLTSRVDSYRPAKSPAELLEDAFDHPIGSPPLESLATGKKNVVLISSDHTRPVPSKLITPILLRRIRAAAPDAKSRSSSRRDSIARRRGRS